MKSSNDKVSNWWWVFRLFAVLVFLLLVFISNQGSQSQTQGFTIQDTIARANRIIAIDASDKPLHRWVFATATDYTEISDKGAIPRHEPPNVSYGTGWTRPRQETSDTVYTDLSQEEWSIVEGWKNSWCKEKPTFQPIPENASFYTVALRCYGYSAKTFRLLKDELPEEITQILIRASTPRN